MRNASGLQVTAHIRKFHRTQGTFVKIIAARTGSGRILPASAVFTLAIALCVCAAWPATADEPGTNAAAEQDTAVVVRTVAETVTIPRADLRERQRTTQSLMPPGLLEALPEREAVELLKYLTEPR